MQETKAEGGVKWTVLALYLKSMGPWYVLSLHLSQQILTELSGGSGSLQYLSLEFNKLDHWLPMFGSESGQINMKLNRWALTACL
jgi:hypothetical protein